MKRLSPIKNPTFTLYMGNILFIDNLDKSLLILLIII